MNKREIKKQNIAKSCCDMFAKYGFINTSVSDIAKSANVGKGTIYEYFSNKEEIVCELMNCLQADYDEQLRDNISLYDNNKEKVLSLFSIFFSNNDVLALQKEIYKQFLIACLCNPSDKLISYNSKLRKKYISFLYQINPKINSEKIYDSIIGFFIASQSLDDYSLKKNIENFINKEIN